MAKATSDQIKEALQKLDSGNDAHWTDDGLPQIAAVRDLTGDQTVKRGDINSALPGFSRAGTEADAGTTDADTSLPGDPVEALDGSVAGSEETIVEAADELTMDEQDLREAMKKRINDTQARVLQASEALREAATFLKKCEDWNKRAIEEYNRRFPPMTAAQAIKDHLRRHQAMKTAEARTVALNPIDAALMSREKGFKRPQNGMPVATRPGQ